jgi:uncharacterized protein (TIGR02145 family)
MKKSLLLLITTSIFFLNSCQKNPEVISPVIPKVPTVLTASIDSIDLSTAISGGNITNDGGNSVTARGIVWSTSSNPTIELSTKTIDGTGTGIFASRLNGLNGITKYYVRAYATTIAGTGYGNELSFFTLLPATVTICNQTWSTKYLDVATYRDGTPIPQVTNRAQWVNSTTGAWCWYNNDSATYASTYGRLYNWYAVNDPRGLAPNGWHIPSDAELTALSTCLGGDSQAGGAIKEVDTTHWSAPNAGATNSSGFTGLPTGHRDPQGTFDNLRFYGSCWSSTGYDLGTAWFRYLSFDNSIFTRLKYGKTYGLSVRCIRD